MTSCYNYREFIKEYTSYIKEAEKAELLKGTELLRAEVETVSLSQWLDLALPM